MMYDDSGATVIEYALIASLISIVVVAALTVIGAEVQDAYQTVADSFPDRAN